jgi:WD40 repeat protein
LLWFADALPLVANNPPVEETHRIRIQQTLDHALRVLNVMADSNGVLASAFSPDGRRIATVTRNNNLALQDARSGDVLWELLHGGKPIRQVRFARDGQRLFVCSSENQGRAIFAPAPPDFQLAEVLEAATGRLVFPPLTSNLVCSAFSPDDRWLAVAFTNHVIQLLDTRNGQPVAELKGHTNAISMLTFNKDGNLLASGSRDGSTWIWRLPSGEPVGKPFADDQPVQRVALSADGRYLATATDVSEDFQNTRVQVWDVQAGEKLGAPMTETGPMHALFFSASGRTKLFTGGEADGVRIWEVGAGVILQRILN